MGLKPGYKQTEVGVIPADWKDCTIQHLIDIGAITGHLDGNHGELYPRSNEFTNFGVPYITANDLRGHTVSFSSCKFLTYERARLFRKGVAINGDVLFAHNATVGPTGLLKTELDYVILSTTATYFRCDPKKLINKFLLYGLQSANFVSQYRAVMAQSTRNQVPITAQRKLSVVLPPTTTEQESIAEALSDADALIESLEQLLAKKRHLKQGAMQELLTGKKRLPGFVGDWEDRQLGVIVEIRKGELITEEIAIPGPIPVIAGGKKPAYSHNASNRSGMTITISGSGANAGYISYYEEPIFASDCSTIGEGEHYSVKFIYFALMMNQNAIYKAQTGGAQPHIHPRDLSPLVIAIPANNEEQAAIAAVLSDMDAEIATMETKLTKGRQLKTGMMQELLTGRIRLI